MQCTTRGGCRSSLDRTFVSVRLAATLLIVIAGLDGLIRTAAGSAPSDVSANDSQTQSTIQGIVTVGMTVSNMARSLAFYTDVLQFKVISDVEVAGAEYEHLQGVFGLRMRICTLKLGDEVIELTEYIAPQGRSIPPESRSNDLWFQHIAIIVSNMDAAYARLREHHVRHASTGPQTIPAWNNNAGGIRAFYFKDPDNHILEVLWFPPDKGNPRWRRSDSLFLGIDHTAIVVADTEMSLAFYRDTLGMVVVGEAENYGSEQERLNNVFGARLRITALRFPGEAGKSGPAIELLEYLAPRDGRPFPADSRACDLWHWQVTLRCTDVKSTETALRATQSKWVSPGVVTMPDDGLGFISGMMARDPDGHAFRIVLPRSAMDREAAAR